MFFKNLSSRSLFSLTPSRSPSPYSFIALCSTSSPSHLTYPHSHGHPDPRNVRVSVWWYLDLENCNVPSSLNVFRGAQAITAAIESSGIKGPIQITAFGDMTRLARTNQEALSSTAINFTHIPHGPLEDPFTACGEMIQNLLHLMRSYLRIPFGESFKPFSTLIWVLSLLHNQGPGETWHTICRKYGPSVLRSVMESDVLQMVDMLISEKWVLESPHLISPFKLTSSAGITSWGV